MYGAASSGGSKMNSPKNLPSIGQKVRLIDTHPRAGQVGIVVDRPWLQHGLAAKVRLGCGSGARW